MKTKELNTGVKKELEKNNIIELIDYRHPANRPQS